MPARTEYGVSHTAFAPSVAPDETMAEQKTVGKHGHEMLGVAVNGTNPLSFHAMMAALGYKPVIALADCGAEVPSDATQVVVRVPRCRLGLGEAALVEGLRVHMVATILWFAEWTALNM